VIRSLARVAGWRSVSTSAKGGLGVWSYLNDLGEEAGSMRGALKAVRSTEPSYRKAPGSYGRDPSV
jgi:hypothetical protein